MTSKELQKLKYQRLSEPEKIVLESFKELKEYVYDEAPYWVYYKSDKGVFYAYTEKFGWLNYDYDLIYIKIQSYFDGNYQLINDFTQSMVEKYLKLKVISINHLPLMEVEKNLKLKVVTI